MIDRKRGEHGWAKGGEPPVGRHSGGHLVKADGVLKVWPPRTTDEAPTQPRTVEVKRSEEKSGIVGGLGRVASEIAPGRGSIYEPELEGPNRNLDDIRRDMHAAQRHLECMGSTIVADEYRLTTLADLVSEHQRAMFSEVMWDGELRG